MIGTHALLTEQVQFADLGMVVIDEQHRFGVEQRDALREKAQGARPHVLVMTATPIPRTVAMTVYGDLDTSTLTELPGRPLADRHPRRAGGGEAPLPGAGVGAHPGGGGGQGRQAYVVCPRIGGEDTDGPGGGADGRMTADHRRPGILPGRGRGGRGARAGRRSPCSTWRPRWPRARWPGCGCGCCTAGCRPRRRTRAMRAFADGPADVLVATTVVEVGVDVPNATVMVVMDADRFGVSQLHQLRGRVGRGSEPGLCLLVTEAARGNQGAGTGWTPWPATLDGFRLAGSTWSSAGRATCSARPRRAASGASSCSACSATRR